MGIISMYCSSSQRDWDTFIPFALFAYNTSMQASTPENPFYLLYGRDPYVPSTVFQTVSPSYSDSDDYRHTIVQNVHEA